MMLAGGRRWWTDKAGEGEYEVRTSSSKINKSSEGNV